jgi:hypothetical protein
VGQVHLKNRIKFHSSLDTEDPASSITERLDIWCGRLRYAVGLLIGIYYQRLKLDGD